MGAQPASSGPRSILGIRPNHGAFHDNPVAPDPDGAPASPTMRAPCRMRTPGPIVMSPHSHRVPPRPSGRSLDAPPHARAASSLPAPRSMADITKPWQIAQLIAQFPYQV